MGKQFSCSDKEINSTSISQTRSTHYARFQIGVTMMIDFIREIVRSHYGIEISEVKRLTVGANKDNERFNKIIRINGDKLLRETEVKNDHTIDL